MESFNIAFNVDFNIWYPKIEHVMWWILTGASMIPIVLFRSVQTSKESIMTISEVREITAISIIIIVIFPPVIGAVLRAIKDSEWKFNFKLMKFQFTRK